MRNGKSVGVALVLVIGMLIMSFAVYKTSTIENDTVIVNIPPQIDTVEVIIEYDGDREIRWYTLDTTCQALDTIEYEYIDTTIIHWPWGREEFYYFKYKNNN